MVYSSVYVIDATCFDGCFLFHVIAGRRYFFSKFVVTVKFFSTAILSFIVVFFKTSVLKEVLILRYLHNNSVVLTLMLMLSSTKSYRILYLYILEKHLYVADFFMITFFTLFIFLTAPHFSLQNSFSFWKNSKQI